MKKEIFNEIFGLMKKLDIPFNIGTRTNVKKMPSVKDLTTNKISESLLKDHVEMDGVSKVLKMFERDGSYIPQFNDLEGQRFLGNLKVLDKIVNPPTPKSAEVHLFSKLPGDPITPEAFAGQKAADQAKLHSEVLKQSMRLSTVDQELANRLKLDMSKISDYEKLQAWKKKNNIPDFSGEAGVGSLFKKISEDPVADVGKIMDNLEKEGKSLVDQMQKITDLAYQMSPEGIAAEKAARKALLKRMNEGKGFAGGVFGKRNDGYFRALVRPFLLKEHEAGRIKLADNTLDSLKNSNDIKSGGGNDFLYPDPVRIFRHHYGDDAFDLIPDQEVFGMGDTGYGPGRDRINEVMTKAGIKPTTVQGPGNPGGYLTKGEYQAKLDELDEVRGYIQRREGRFDNMSQKEITEELADLDQQGASIKMAMEQDYPGYEVISGESKKGKEIADKLGITAKPGYPVTEAGKADLKVVKPVTKTGFTDPFKTVDMSFGQTKARPSIRLIKNFERDLTDIELAKEGYNLQEIDILMRARKVMKEEGQNPDDALAWVRGEMADDAGVDIEEFMPDFDWGDFPGKYSTGGGVGSMFRRV